MGDEDTFGARSARLVAERGPAVRRQHAAAVPLSVAAFVAAVTLVPMFLQGSGGSAGPDRDISPHPIVHYPPDPWEIDACPATLTREFAAVLPSRIATIRICDLPEAQGGSPRDALILHLSGLVADLESVQAADPARCAGSEPVTAGAAMVVTDRSGAETLVPVEGCYDIGVGGRRIDVSDMREIVLQHLSTQRRTTPGRWSGGPPALPCEEPPTAALFDPGIERVVAASVCRRSGVHQFLTGTDLGMVQSAWESAVRSHGPANPCPDNGDRTRVVVTTDFGDLIAFDFDRCGSNAQVSSLDGRPWHLPLDERTRVRLGLT